MNYAQFLKMLLALGPRLPQVMSLIQHIVNDVQELVAILKPEQAFGVPMLDYAGTTAEMAEIQDAEGRIIALCPQLRTASAQHGISEETFGAIGDGAILRMIYDFIQQNPALIQLFLTLLKLA